jgi:hypothetical protein
MSRACPLTWVDWLVNWVRPVASMTPGRVRAWAAIAAIRSASTARASRIVADAGCVPMYALRISLALAAQANSTPPNTVRLTATASTISANRDQLARRSRRSLTVSRLLLMPAPPSAHR